MAVQKSCGILFVAIVALLVSVNSLPLRNTREAESLQEMSMKELVKSLRVAKSVLVRKKIILQAQFKCSVLFYCDQLFFNLQTSEFNQLGNYEDITDIPAFLEIVHNITKMAELQTSVNEQLAELGDEASVQLNSTKVLVDMVIDNACNWVSYCQH